MGLLFFSQSCFLSSAKRVNNIRQVTVLMTVIFWVKKKKKKVKSEDVGVGVLMIVVYGGNT